MMKAALFVLAHYFALGLIALLSYLYGRQLTRKVQYASGAEQVSISLALGLGVFAHLIFFIGLLGLLYKSVVIIILAACALNCYPIWTGWLRQAPASWQRLKSGRANISWERAGVALLGLVFLAPILALPLYPPISFDATSYHLPLAKTFVQHHRIIVTPFLRFQVFPMINEMWFTLALLLGDDILAHLIQLLALSTSVLAIFSFGQRYFSARAGVWAAALLLASPMILWIGSVGYTDISLLLFLLAAVYSFANWLQSARRHWLVLTGVFCGFAAGVKYTACFFLGLFVLVSLYRAVRARTLRAPIILSAVAAAVASPWYVRNYIYTRNPLFPFLPQLFGYSWWSAEDLQGVLDDLHQAHGIGRSLWAFVSLPWHLAFNQQVFFAEVPWSPICFVVLPLTAIWAIKNPRVRWLLALCVTYMLFWFFAGQLFRYLLPIMPLLCLATAATFDGLMLRLLPRKGWADAKWIALVVTIALAATGWYYAVTHWQEHGPFPVTRAQREAYLTRQLPSYPAYQTLNRLNDRHVKLYSFHDENMIYFVNGETMGDWFGPVRYPRLLAKMSDGAMFYDELRGLGVNYLLVNDGRFSVPLPDDQFFQAHFEPLYARGTITLFKLSDKAGGQRPASTQLLKNTGFELLADEWPALWGHAGSPTVDSSGANAKTGQVAVRCQGAENTFYQAVPVKPAALYVLSYMARAPQTGQRARLQVNWSDSQAKFISTDIELCDVGAEWRRCVMNVKAPAQAATAVVFTSCHEQSAVWFDDYSFAELSATSAPPANE